LIQRNKNKASQEEIELEELLEMEELARKERAGQHISAEIEEIREKRKANEKLIDELMFSDANAKDIVASHKQSVAAQEQYVLFFIQYSINIKLYLKIGIKRRRAKHQIPAVQSLPFYPTSSLPASGLGWVELVNPSFYPFRDNQTYPSIITLLLSSTITALLPHQ